MDNWFTIEQIDNTTYAISEYQHWEETHAYLLIGSNQALLIDTGLGVGNIKEVVESLTKLPILVVTTHVHWDHIGGHHYFDNFAVHELEKDWISEKFPIPLAAVKQSLLAQGTKFPKDFLFGGYQIFKGEPCRLLKDKDKIDIGNRCLEVIHTPGHSPGHICLYEPDRGYLYSGDLIYQGKLDAFYATTDPVAFMKSVQTVNKLPFKKILPGHHTLNIHTNLIQEIEEGFVLLYQSGKLEQGNGIYDFEHFKIHI